LAVYKIIYYIRNISHKIPNNIHYSLNVLNKLVIMKVELIQYIFFIHLEISSVVLNKIAHVLININKYTTFKIGNCYTNLYSNNIINIKVC